MKVLLLVTLSIVFSIIPNELIAPTNNIQHELNSCIYYNDLPDFSVSSLLSNIDMILFMDSIGFRESSGNYEAVNSFGFLGKYQFSPTTLFGLGIDVHPNEYLSNPELQDSSFIALLHHNRRILYRYITEFDGTEWDTLGVITKSGILASAHLIGPHRTKQLLVDGVDFSDAYGTYASEYLIQFSGYNIIL
jgi:hypothetical protein